MAIVLRDNFKRLIKKKQFQNESIERFVVQRNWKDSEFMFTGGERINSGG